ncbi:hypothetical protein DSM112329_03621 [Paraconexibacter sp. AEG42_29]|uniref:Glycolipid-binding domain-containing protein n=1 Tax=Paraconexibacter sp. AEG42_29 TaxID=2997339 RepID=A0AAU7AYF8_9ACTN
MTAAALPHQVAWRHGTSREGIEVAFLHRSSHGYLIDGRTVAVEDGHGWAVRYHIALDAQWQLRHAVVTTFADADPEERMTTLDYDGDGRWRVDGLPAPQLKGCLDLDLECSALTNAFPVRRLSPGVGDEFDAPAAYVRIAAEAPRRADQTYRRIDDEDGRSRYDYHAPEFDFQAVIEYDGSGFVVAYPGIADRIV